MSRGGAKPGERRGGRQPGTANKRTREIADKASAEGITPLEYMLNVMRAPLPQEFLDKLNAMEENSKVDPELLAALVGWNNTRFEAAKAAAPYIHPRLQSNTVKVTDTIDIRVIERVIVRE